MKVLGPVDPNSNLKMKALLWLAYLQGQEHNIEERQSFNICQTELLLSSDGKNLKILFLCRDMEAGDKIPKKYVFLFKNARRVV